MPRLLAFASMTRRNRSPSTNPGRTELTRMPAGPSSADSDLVKPITAHFEAQYGLRRAIPNLPAIEERLTIEGCGRIDAKPPPRCGGGLGVDADRDLDHVAHAIAEFQV